MVPLCPPVCLHLIVIIFLSKIFIVISVIVVGILSVAIFSIVSTDNLSGECFLHRTSRSLQQQQQQHHHLSTAAVEAVDGVDAGAHHGVAVEEVAHAAVLRPGKRCQRNFAVALTISISGGNYREISLSPSPVAVLAARVDAGARAALGHRHQHQQQRQQQQQLHPGAEHSSCCELNIHQIWTEEKFSHFIKTSK